MVGFAHRDIDSTASSRPPGCITTKIVSRVRTRVHTVSACVVLSCKYHSEVVFLVCVTFVYPTPFNPTHIHVHHD